MVASLLEVLNSHDTRECQTASSMVEPDFGAFQMDAVQAQSKDRFSCVERKQELAVSIKPEQRSDPQPENVGCQSGMVEINGNNIDQSEFCKSQIDQQPQRLLDQPVVSSPPPDQAPPRAFKERPDTPPFRMEEDLDGQLISPLKREIIVDDDSDNYESPPLIKRVRHLKLRKFKKNKKKTKTGKHRAFITDEHKAILEEVWKTTKFPEKDARVEIGQRLGLDQRQVQIWFQNMRSKEKKETPS